MLSSEHGIKEDGHTWMPGFAPSDNLDFTIEVLGPVVEEAPNGKKGLRTFSSSMTATAMNDGKTKNGHSVILRLQYRDFSVLFGNGVEALGKPFHSIHQSFVQFIKKLVIDGKSVELNFILFHHGVFPDM